MLIKGEHTNNVVLMRNLLWSCHVLRSSPKFRRKDYFREHLQWSHHWGEKFFQFYYDYHKDIGHTIENCYHFKKDIKNLIPWKVRVLGTSIYLLLNMQNYIWSWEMQIRSSDPYSCWWKWMDDLCFNSEIRMDDPRICWDISYVLESMYLQNVIH